MDIKEEKVELLRKVDLFSQLREYELDIIADYSDYISVKKGDAIFCIGSEACDLFVVSSGRVGILGYEGNGEAVIAQIAANESFGELDFIGRTVRSAAAFADDDTILLRFPSESHRAEDVFQKHSFIFARLLYNLLANVSERIWKVNKLLYDKTDWLLDLHKQLLCDKMTGLYNQVFLKEDFVNLLPDTGKSLAFLMIKPDNFKDINDKFGHVAGDQVLNLMAIFLQSELTENDIGIRYRGDEYAAILVDTDKDAAVKRADAIRKTFIEMDISRITGADSISINVSIGICMYPDDADSSAMLVSNSHKRMMAARKFGGNTIISG